MMPTLCPKKQQGVALIIVLMVIALTTIIATQMSGTLMFQQQRNENLESNQQAYWYAMGAEAFAKSVLYQDFNESKNVTHIGQMWASGEMRFPVELGEISGEIFDLQACLNLNALNSDQTNQGSTSPPGGASSSTPSASAPAGGTTGGAATPASGTTTSGSASSGSKTNGELAKEALKELIVSLEIDGIGNFEAESMTDALVDWLDEDNSIVSAGGAEDDDYAAKEFPYLAANSKLGSVNELRVIEHFTPQVILALKPYVCVLPDSDLHKININTMDGEDVKLLQALLGGTDEGTAQDILSARPEDGFATIAAFTGLSELAKVKNINQLKQQFVIDSDYFKLTTKTSFNGSFFTLNSTFMVKNDELLVVNRSIGAH